MDALLQLEVVVSSASAQALGPKATNCPHFSIQLVGLALVIGGGLEQQGDVYTLHRVQLNWSELHQCTCTIGTRVTLYNGAGGTVIG